MRLEKILRYWVIFVILVAAALVVATKARAQGDECRGNHPCNNTNGGDVTVPVDVAVTTGDMVGGETIVSTGGNKSVAVVAPGLGDVDIAQCLGSTQWSLLVGGKQKLVLNHVCMAEFYLKQGRYDLAAQSLCNQPEVLEEYGTESQCELDHDFTPAEPSGEGSQGVADAIVSHHDEDLAEVQMQQAGLVAQLDYLTEQLEEAQQQPEPVYVQQPAPEPAYTDEEVLNIWALLDQKGEDDE